MRHTSVWWVALLAISSLIVAPDRAAAARSPPDPLVTQFDEGHGLLIGAIIAVADDKPRDEWDHPLRITFRVEEVIAAPTTDQGWPIERGGTFSLRTYAGYGGAFEDWYQRGEDSELTMHTGSRPPVGAKFLMSVRRDREKGGLDHADGAGVAEPLLGFPADRRRAIREVRDLAVLVGHARLARCRALAGDVAATELLRVEAIRHLAGRCFHPHPPRDAAKAAARESERRETAKVLRQAWVDSGEREPETIVYAIDAALNQADFSAFHDSKERREVWLEHLLAPPVGPPALAGEVLRRRSIGMLANVAGSDPARVAGPLMREMANDRWPVQFRIGLHHTLTRIRQDAKVPDARWELASQEFLAQALPRADGYETRQLVGAIQYLIGTDEQRPSRLLTLTPEITEALRSARERAKAAASKPGGDDQFRIALPDLDELLRRIDRRDADDDQSE